MEQKIVSERLYVKIDETGKLVEASYLPMVDSRVEPVPTPLIPAATTKSASFQINEQGIIIEASPPNLNGHKLVLHAKSDSALGRTDAVTPKRVWVPDGKGGWICV
ncbi:MAG TPA: hypothetical protein PK250_00775 [Syntrophobacter fumaroxidans]|nr:hypothetical protein [Syntrophobacter fumaroxidans]